MVQGLCSLIGLDSSPSDRIALACAVTAPRPVPEPGICCMHSSGSPVCHCYVFPPHFYLQILGVPHGQGLGGTGPDNLFAPSLGLGHLYCAGSDCRENSSIVRKSFRKPSVSSFLPVYPLDLHLSSSPCPWSLTELHGRFACV